MTAYVYMCQFEIGHLFRPVKWLHVTLIEYTDKCVYVAKWVHNSLLGYMHMPEHTFSITIHILFEKLKVQ